MVRQICIKCKQAICICNSLPSTPIELIKSKVVIFQHPHERRRKNRSVPLIQLSLPPESIHVIVGRKPQPNGINNEGLLNTLRGRNILVVFPLKDKSLPLEDAIDFINNNVRQQKNHRTSIFNGSVEGNSSSPLSKVITFVFFDATWKHAKEMLGYSLKSRIFREDVTLVHIDVPSSNDYLNSKSSSCSIGETNKAYVPLDYRPNRFAIRVAPSSSHLSTAECIAWILSYYENKSELYQELMRPLDQMVNNWRNYLKDIPTTSKDDDNTKEVAIGNDDKVYVQA